MTCNLFSMTVFTYQYKQLSSAEMHAGENTKLIFFNQLTSHLKKHVVKSLQFETKVSYF